MEDVQRKLRRKIGRPLGFDREAALEIAMRLFWQHGYEATSLGELTRAMGITSPSIYAAYGDKKGLFLEAVERYLARPLTPTQIIASTSSAREAARGFLEGAAVAFTGEDTPPGCLLASSAIAYSTAASDVGRELSAIRLGIEKELRDRIEHGMRQGELAADTDADALAATVIAAIQGMSTLARDGAPREKLQRIAQAVMRAWPET